MERRDHLLFMLDERLSKEKTARLSQLVNSFHAFSQVFVVEPNATQEDLLKRLAARDYRLVLLPWNRYLEWRRVEAFFGSPRPGAPRVAGYFSDPVAAAELMIRPSYLRCILLDFSQPSLARSAQLVWSLMYEQRPPKLADSTAPEARVYEGDWHVSEAKAADNVIDLPEFAENGWAERANEVREVIQSMWSVAFELQGDTQSSQARFEVGFESGRMRLKVRFPTEAPLNLRDIVGAYWPSKTAIPSDAIRALLALADSLRVHPSHDLSELDLTVELSQVRNERKTEETLGTLWIETLKKAT